MRKLNCQYRKQVSEMVQLNTELQMRFDELVRQRNRLLVLPEEQQELDRIRGQYQTMEMETAALITLYTNLRLRNEELSRENALRSKLNTPFSPIPAQNLQPAIMSVAQLDGTIVQPMIDTSLDSFDTRIKNFLTQHLQQHYPGPISAPTPFGATVSSGLPGTLQSQPNPILTVSGRALSNTEGTPNDYDKAMEVEQCKLCNDACKLVFDGCATNSYRQQKIRILDQKIPDNEMPYQS